jgi:hypothetical protein
LEKKYYPERSAGVEIFYSKPAEQSGAALPVCPADQNFRDKQPNSSPDVQSWKTLKKMP